MDMLGHLNQSVYHEMIEEGRVALIAEVMRRADNEHGYGGYVLAHVDLDHRAEVRKDHGEVDIVTRLARVGTSSVQIDHEVRLPDGTVAASGSSVLVAWDPVTRGKRVLSEKERAALT
jgi:acyl-CoA thioester hydrolase